jgi:hypothetical protein
MTTRTIQTASHWGVYNVTTDDDGRILQTSPLQDDPHPATFCDGLCDIVHSELRIDRPYVRRGFLRHRETSRHLRGNDHFVAVTWDEALSLVAQELKRVTTAFGNESIYGGSYGWASAGRLHHSPSVLKRFLGMNGGYVDKLGNHSFGAALHIMPYVIGRADIPRQAMPWPLIVAHTRLLVMFGGAHRKNSQIDSGGMVLHETRGWIDKARDAGIELVTISPSRDDAADSAIGRWIPIRPNTDVALMLGLAHTLATEGLHSLDFLARYCVGYSRFESYLLGKTDGQPKDAEWAAAITQVDAPRGRHAHAHDDELVRSARRPWRATDLDERRPGGDAGTNRLARRRLQLRPGRHQRHRNAPAGQSSASDAAARHKSDHQPRTRRAGCRDASQSGERARLQRSPHPASPHQADLFGRRKSVSSQYEPQSLCPRLATTGHGHRP